MSDTTDWGSLEGGEGVAGEGSPSEWRDYNIGPRVSAVFTAAEKAAEHMLTMAREEADDIRRRAEAETEEYRDERRRRAEEEARRIVEEALAQAQSIEDAAREAAREVEEAARRRAERADEGTRLLEERIEWASAGLRDVAVRLAAGQRVPTAPRTDAPTPAEPASPQADVPEYVEEEPDAPPDVASADDVHEEPADDGRDERGMLGLRRRR